MMNRIEVDVPLVSRDAKGTPVAERIFRAYRVKHAMHAPLREYAPRRG